MAIGVNWATQVISVYKVDMTQIQTVPIAVYELDLNVFRLALKDLEDDEDGMVFLDTHSHNPPLEVGGVELARTVEIINNYTVTFEDGQYAVNLKGANSNVGDRVNVNQVSVRSANSAGLVTSQAIEFGEYGDKVTIDVQNTTGKAVAGATYPIGTLRKPVDNVADAMLIASSRGFSELYFISNVTLTTGDNLPTMTIRGINPTQTHIEIETGANVLDCEVCDCTLTGILDGGSSLRDCTVDTLNYVNGSMHHCQLNGTITLGGNTSAHIHGCYSGVPGASTPVIDMGGSGQSLGLRDYHGGIKLVNKSGTDDVSIDMSSGQVKFGVDVTAGTIQCRGVGYISEDLSVGATINDFMLNPDTVADQVLEEIVSDHNGVSGSLADILTDVDGDVLTLLRLTGNKVTKSGDVITIYEENGSTVWRQYNLASGGRVEV